MGQQFQELKDRLATAGDIYGAAALLSWDQTTYMPVGGGAARARQLATLGGLAHQHLTDPAIGRLLDELQPWADSLPADSDDAALIRVARRDFERANKVPAAFISELYSHTAASYEAWIRARPDNDFKSVQPFLEKTLDLSRRYAEYLGGGEHIADPLIDQSDEGMTAAAVRSLFGELRAQLVPLVQAITAQLPASGSPADASVLNKFYPEAAQWKFGEDIIRQIGFDFERGRQDKTHHPYMTKFSIGDVRITTRFNERDFGDGLFSTIHETGHAVYEQGVNPAYESTPLDGGASSGVHESQSRLWENIVGRSRAFWQYAYPLLQKEFPEQLAGVPLDTFYRAINRVQRSLIRVDADEVTYNLHVMIRFDLELALLEGSLAVKDLPEAWHERYRSDLGVTAPDDRDGVLQDVHWYGGTIGGAFQGYTLGNILSAQIFDSAVAAHPSITSEIGEGRFDTLHGWLKQNLYTYGRKYPVPELIKLTTGRELSIQPYINYLRTKYGELYSL